MDNKEYLLKRIGWERLVSKAFQEKRNQCMVIDKLNSINNGDGNPLKLQGMFSASYPATFRVKYNDRQKDVRVWVKESRIGYNTVVPYTLLNECKLMKTVINDMFLKRRSPHFIYPIIQVLSNDISISEDMIVKEGEFTVPANVPLCSSRLDTSENNKEHLSIFNVMEYADPSKFMPMRAYIERFDTSVYENKFEITMAIFQILYNLAVMEHIKFRHGDLHLDNVLINPLDRFEALYVIDKGVNYIVPSPVFTMFIDFDRSIINTDNYKSIYMPDQYLDSKPCSVSRNEEGKNVPDLPNGVVDDCWKVWNPYADLTRFFAYLFSISRTKIEIIDMIFGPDSEVLSDLKRLIVSLDKHPFGRQSMKELEEEFKDDPDFLERCRPINVLKRYSKSLFPFPFADSDIQKYPGQVYYIR